MYRTADGREIFVIDAHTHLWDASPENQRGKLGKGWIDCFYAYHRICHPPIRFGRSNTISAIR